MVVEVTDSVLVGTRTFIANPYTNVDALYGPWELTVSDGTISSGTFKNKAEATLNEMSSKPWETSGFTIGVKNSDGTVEEYWWQKDKFVKKGGGNYTAGDGIKIENNTISCTGNGGTYGAGNGLSLGTDNKFSIKLAENSNLSVDNNGLKCTLSDKTYSAGAGLSLTGTTFNAAIANDNNNILHINDNGLLVGLAAGSDNTIIVDNKDDGGITYLSVSSLVITRSESSVEQTIQSQLVVDGTLTSTTQINANTIYATNTITAAGGFFDPSDDRKKDYKGDVDIPLDKLLEIPLKTFTYKGKDKIEIGTSAQSLQKICPELVKEDADGYLTVNYSKLSVLALAGLKQMDERLRKLEEIILKKDN